MTKRELYRRAADLFQSHDLDGAFADFYGSAEDEELATQVQQEIVTWLRKKAGDGQRGQHD